MAPLPVTEFERRLPELLRLLQALVELESPSTEKAAVDALGAFLAARLAEAGAAVERIPQSKAGDHWLARWGSGSPGVLLLTHLDTVHPLGTLAHIPYRDDGERVFGPGVLDMKASLAMAVTAMEALCQSGTGLRRRVTLLCSSDEETGSRTSRPLIEQLGSEHEAIFTLEPALPNGALKTERKGVGLYRIEVQGRAAHAGANPEDGVNAVVEMAHQILRLSALADPAQGTTINVGVVHGGTRSNVVPESCQARLDLRVQTPEEAARVEAAIHALSPVLPGASVSVEGGINRPPMTRSPVIAQAFERAKSIAATIGLSLTEGSTGGASDANFLAGLNRPLLDGLGAVGDQAHSEREFVVRRSLPERTALLAALISEW
ncbi:MAG: M20 family metallopeptidase [Chloroflexota bacterium]